MIATLHALPAGIDAIQSILGTQGLHAALRALNARTPHRYTGIYRYDGAMLRNLILFDQHNPEMTRGEDAPMEATYCALLPANAGVLDVGDARLDLRTAQRATATPVVSYCGIPLFGVDGAPFGTLCHFDLMPCEQRTSDLALLNAVGPALLEASLAL
jgi:hypothetical protein